MNYDLYLTLVGQSIRAIVFILDSTDRRVAEILETPYRDKHSMKLVGSTAIIFRAKICELAILGLAKTVEDLLSAIKKMGGKEYRFWDDFNGHEYVCKAKMIRHLSNVIKHHEGFIDKSFGVKDCSELVDTYGFPDQFPIGSWALFDKGPDPCLYKNTFWVEQFCLQVILEHSGIRKKTHNVSDDQIKEYIIQKWLGEFLKLESNIQLHEESS